MAQLSRMIIGMLPLQNNPVTGARCTAREAYQSLRCRYGGGNIQYALLKHKKLAVTNCTSIAAIPNFIQNWLNLAQTLKETTEYKNKIAHEIKYPTNFTKLSFHELVDKVLDEANGTLINHELSQMHPTTHSDTAPKAPHPQCGNPKCPYLLGHMTATCWHESGGDPGGKEKYEERRKAKQMPRANYAFSKTQGDDLPGDIQNDETNKSNTCTEPTESNEDIFYSYIPGTYESIQPMANTLLNLWDSNPKTFFSAM
ncbi:hypothetical protein ARMGADRAFT_1022718 [Armillaria gallica]|uniref:Uncharacterized protein n=1 Tax=Armillaria gallica TaxID=47427 RepID=A0A2H3EY48_ARMGA|nr:hypothetical protein ARMGADRAFT_1022718 [Armillaria gallica]